MKDKKDLYSFYYDLLNIKGNKNDPAKIIDEIVSKNVQELVGVTGDTEGLCKVAANNISFELNENNISNRILNTREITGGYEHFFIVAYYKEEGILKYTLVDPTFNQFVPKENRYLTKAFVEWPSTVLDKTEKGSEMVENLLSKGYVSISQNNLDLYLGSFTNDNKVELNIEDVIVGDTNKKTR